MPQRAQPPVSRQVPDGEVVQVGAVEERTAMLRSGVALPYAETGRAGRSIPVVMVHAYVESWRYFEHVLRALPESIHAFAPTQRGHRAVQGKVVGYRLSDFATDIVDFLDVVGTARAVLVGASSGGLVSQAVATSHPERVAGLVLISSPVTLTDKPGVAAMREDIMALSDPIDPRFVERFVRSTAPHEVSEEFMARLVDESLGVPATVWRESFLGLLEVEPPQSLEHIRVPTLLLSGSSDDFVREDQQVLLGRIPDVELVVYDGVGHGPHLARPRSVAADLAGFLHGNRLQAAAGSNDPQTTT
jgi:pimeloyl-ACP methyl ester carboxylesterase